MTTYINYHHLDYLTYSTLIPHDELSLEDCKIIERGVMGYNRTAIFESTGTRAYWNTDNPQMRVHVVLSGDTIDWYRYNGIEDIDLLESCMRKGKIKRVDTTVTSHPDTITESHELTPSRLNELANNGHMTTKIKSRSEVSQRGKIQTMYVGSRKKRKRLFRGYDSGIEQGFVSDWLQRYELQSSGDGAMTVARTLLAGASIGSVINKYISFEDEVWESIVGSESANIIKTPDLKKPDTVKWLRDTASPALARVASEHDTPLAILSWFIDVTRQKLDKIMSEKDQKLD